MLARIVSVGELNRLAKELLEGNLPLMWVAGEISNFMRATSGHCYFSIKDEGGEITVSTSGSLPAAGAEVAVKGTVKSAIIVGGKAAGLHVAETQRLK